MTAWGSFGSDKGRFFFPFGVAVDDAGHIDVADAGNHRIHQFRMAATTALVAAGDRYTTNEEMSLRVAAP